MVKPERLEIPQSYINGILKDAASAEVSFAAGSPDRELIDLRIVSVLREIIEEQSLKNDFSKDLIYGSSLGISSLREKIAAIESKRLGIDLNTDNVLIISGSQQAFGFGFQLFASNHTLVMEMPTYLGAIPSAQMYAGNIKTVNIDSNGMIVDDLEKLLAETNKGNINALYTIPHGHNPGGVPLSVDRRQRLLALAQDYGLIIFEDDPYYATSEKPLPSIMSGDKKLANVVRFGTFSKELVNLRVAWVVASPDTILEMGNLKSANDLHTALLNQQLILGLIKKMEDIYGSYQNYLSEVIMPHYRLKRENMGSMLEKYFGDTGVTWNTPQEGLFFWVQFPEGVDTEKLYEISRDQFGLIFVPGVGFDPLYHIGDKNYVSPIRNYARLNFSCPTSDQIEKGMILLRKAYDLYKAEN